MQRRRVDARGVVRPREWAEQGSAPLRWLLTVASVAILFDMAWTDRFRLALQGDGLWLGTGLICVACLLTWWRFDAFAIALCVPLVAMAAAEDARAGVFLVPPLMGVVALTASRRVMLPVLGLSVVWYAALPLFSPDDAEILPVAVVLELVCVGIGLTLRRRAFRHATDQQQLEESRRLIAEQAEAERQAAEDVRQSVSRDLHDVVAHGLTVIKLQADVALFASDLERAHDALARISDTSQQALTDLRVMLRLLQSAELPAAPGSGATQESASTLRLEVTGPQFRDTLEELGYPTSLTVDPELVRLTRGEETILHRILQEVTTNILKHTPKGSRCTIEIGIEHRHEALFARLRVTNALPEKPATPPVPAGRQLKLGLLSMRERVESVGGTFDAGPENGRWVTQAEIPVQLRPVREAVPELSGPDTAAITSALTGKLGRDEPAAKPPPPRPEKPIRNVLPAE